MQRRVDLAELLLAVPEIAEHLVECLGHLLELEYLPEMRLDEFMSGAEILTAADMTNKATWEASFNDMDITDLTTRFRTRRMALVARLDALQPDVAIVVRGPSEPAGVIVVTKGDSSPGLRSCHEASTFLKLAGGRMAMA